jgi:hypothetical protein
MNSSDRNIRIVTGNNIVGILFYIEIIGTIYTGLTIYRHV